MHSHPEMHKPHHQDETRPLLYTQNETTSHSTHVGSNEDAATKNTPPLTKGGLIILLLGVFLVNSDSAVQFTLFRSIASDFGKLESASWIVNSYMMGVLVFMPLCGKLSDIFGRLPILAIMYACYAVGALISLLMITSGLGLAWWATLLGRGIAGISNGGIGVLVSIVVVDVLPIRDVALWRSYVYMVNQLGRAVGPSLGGLVADSIDWRWALLFQVPFHLFSLSFVLWVMSRPAERQCNKASDQLSSSSWNSSKFQRIDFLGSISIAIANVAMLLFLDRFSKGVSLRSDVYAIVALVSWIIFFAAFLLIEAFWAREPILPLGLYVKPNVVAANVIQLMQTAAQVSLYSTIPLYLRVMGRDQSLQIAGRLVLITIGVIVGGTLSGFLIKRTGRYRPLIWISLVLSTVSHLVIFLWWRASARVIESLYGMGAGFGFGVSISASFICLNVGLEHSQVAVATSGFYLSLNAGCIVSLALASLLITTGVRTLLLEWLGNEPNATKIIHDVTSDLNNIKKLSGPVKDIVTMAYVRAITNVWLLGFICGCLALVSSFLIPAGRLRDTEEKRKSQTYDTFQREGPESEPLA